MSAMFNVEFHRKSDGAYEGVYVNSADARSLKKPALRLATRKAVAKAKDKLKKKGLKVRDYEVTSCRCVG